ncbi:MAG: GNAT family N-acetyltransferase [Deltaproteobacteria bacterium]|nr:GNAT family N-acetyltransferase [Deltaproteobacteria bacterium]
MQRGMRDGIEYDVVEASRAEEAVALFCRCFSAREPVARALRATPEMVDGFLGVHARAVAPQGLSVLAREVGTREVVGVLFAEDHGLAAASPPSLTESAHPLLAAVAEYRARTSALKAGARVLAQPRRPGVVLHQAYLGVAESATGRGIGRRLVEEGLSLARDHGFSRAFVGCSSPISARIWIDRLGFQVLGRVVWDEIRVPDPGTGELVAPLRGIADGFEAYLLAYRELDVA